MLRLAIDTGGTFTDCVLQDGTSGRLWFWKTLSTPEAPERSVLEGVEGLRTRRAFALAEVEQILIATTVATNAILERKGARVVLLTTAGFRDVLILGRAKRHDTYDLHLEKPRPLVPRRDILEVEERVDHRGAVLAPLAEPSVAAALAALEARRPEAVAIALLHAYANPEHERRLAERVREWDPAPPVSLSSEVSPKYREYERTSTTVANAYVAPVVGRFLDRLQAAFAAGGFRGELYVMQSSAGLLPPGLARAFPVHVIESGPAAGVLLGGVIGRRENRPHVLTFDMGGTTAKVGAVEDGEPAVSSTFEVDGVNLRQWSGLPLNIPAVELVEIGAGGGSIAVAEMGLVRVGPESAGAVPGPVCYARGGERVTITDANLVLGYLDPARFAGGRLPLDAAAARAAVAEQLARPLGLSLHAAAWGVHAVANASMERALRSMSIERGRDPRDYAMVAFGGAGPLHACRVARALGIRQVIVPWGAGVGSAVGMLAAEPRFTVALTRILALDGEADPAVAELFADLETRVRAAIGARAEPAWVRHAYLRYRGQGFELRVELPPGPIEPGYHDRVLALFHAAYERAYGYAQPADPVEATDWSLTALLPAVRAESGGLGDAATAGAGAAGPGVVLESYFPEAGGVVDCPVHDRYRLGSGDAVEGPAIVADAESTALLPPGDRAVVDPHGHLVIAVRPEEVA